VGGWEAGGEAAGAEELVAVEEDEVLMLDEEGDTE
jgi:hypothetical protein